MTRSFKNLKICLITNYFKSVGGISGQVEILNDNLVNEGAKVEIFSTKVDNFLRPFILLKLLKDCKKFDIIHIHGCSYWGGFFPIMVGTIAGKILRKKIIITYHGGDAENFLRSHKTITKFFLNLADTITVPSDFLANVFKKFGFNAKVVFNIIDIGYFRYKKREKIIPILLIVKHLEPVYDIGMAIKSFHIVKKKYADAKLQIVGDGTQKNELDKLIKDLNLKDVDFLGKIRNNQLQKIYDNSDIFVHTSKIESFGMVLIEAMTSGLPIVSTNVGGIPSIIQNGINGFLVDSGDYQEMAKKVIYLLENQKFTLNLIKNGQKTLDKYTWDSLAKIWLDIYKN